MTSIYLNFESKTVLGFEGKVLGIQYSPHSRFDLFAVAFTVLLLIINTASNKTDDSLVLWRQRSTRACVWLHLASTPDNVVTLSVLYISASCVHAMPMC